MLEDLTPAEREVLQLEALERWLTRWRVQPAPKPPIHRSTQGQVAFRTYDAAGRLIAQDGVACSPAHTTLSQDRAEIPFQRRTSRSR